MYINIASVKTVRKYRNLLYLQLFSLRQLSDLLPWDFLCHTYNYLRGDEDGRGLRRPQQRRIVRCMA